MKPFSAKRLELGIATIASETTDPNTGGGTPGDAGSLWLRQGNGTTTPTQMLLNTTGGAKTWTLQNLIHLKIYNVKSFGAIGNGVADDMAAINAAIQAAQLAGGGVIYFPPGIFRVTRPVTGVGSIALSNAHDLVFLGDGFASQLAMIGDSLLGDWYLFRLRNGTSRIKILNLSFESNITNPDPGSQNHFINISGVAGDPFGGTSEVEVSGCYFGQVPGAGVRNLGEAGELVQNVRCTYNDFDMVSSRSCVEAQRFTDDVNVLWNYASGAHDQQYDFEPTSGTAPKNWSVIGNHINHVASTSDLAITISGSGNTDDFSDERLICAHNTTTNGGSIGSSKGVLSCVIVGNVVIIDRNNSVTAPIDLVRRVENTNISSNVCINTASLSNRGIRCISVPGVPGSSTGNAARDTISDNIVTALGASSLGINIGPCEELVVEGNLVQVTVTSGTLNAIGIQVDAISLDVDHVVVTGNMIIGLSLAMLLGVNFSTSGANQHNSLMTYNWIRFSQVMVDYVTNTGELELDWRGCHGNNGVNITLSAINGPTTGEGATIESNAGPGAQILQIQRSTSPETFTTAPVGSVALNALATAGQGKVLWMKETGTGVSGGNTGWVQQGAVELEFGVVDSGTANAFVPPGTFATARPTEIKWAMPRAGTIRNLRLTCVAGVGAATATWSLRKNGVAACNISVLNTATSGTSANTTAVIAGDLISMQISRSVAITAGQKNAIVTYELTT